MLTIVFITTALLVIILHFVFGVPGMDAGNYGTWLFLLTIFTHSLPKLGNNLGLRGLNYRILSIFSRWPSLNRFYFVSGLFCLITIMTSKYWLD